MNPAGSSPSAARRFRIARAEPADVPDLQALIRALANFERLGELCVSTEADLMAALFGPRPAAADRCESSSWLCSFALRPALSATNEPLP